MLMARTLYSLLALSCLFFQLHAGDASECKQEEVTTPPMRGQNSLRRPAPLSTRAATTRKQNQTKTVPTDFAFDERGNLQKILFEAHSPLEITAQHLKFRKVNNGVDWVITFPDGTSLAFPLGSKSKLQLQTLQLQHTDPDNR